MCKKFISLMSFVLLLGLCSAALGTTYYVSPSGNDDNSGTSTQDAWQTTDKVNSMTFSPGDSILFEGGETFNGGLVFTSGGTPTSPITLSSYGSGRATIQGDLKETVLLVDNCAGFEVRDLIFRGSGNTHQNADLPDFHGIRFFAHAGSGVKHEYIRIDNVEVSGVTNRGIFFDGLDFSGFKDVEVTNTVIHDIGLEGMNSSTNWPVSMDSHEDFYIADCVVYDVTGIHDAASQTGSGIVFGGLNGGVIEFCEAYNNGQLNAAGGGGPVGIWCWESVNVVFQYNESHHNKTFGGDGGGFDLDGGTSFCTMQYNYSHDNQGGDLIMQFARSRYAGDNVYRYNVNANNGTGSWEGKPMGCVTFYSDSSLSNVDLYNNTIYVGPDSRAGAITIWVYTGTFTNINVRNNIFITEPGKPVITTWTGDENFTFQGNCYWSMGGPIRFILDSDDNPTVYEGLDWWRSYGQEMLDSSPVGYEFDPKLADVSNHPVLGPHNLTDLTGYKIGSDSPAIDRGLDLPTLFGTDVGTADFYGNSIPQGSDYDIGANEELGGGQVPIPDPPAPDPDPPTPDPMTFATAPYSTSSSSIAMEATTASDTSGVQYYFTCTSGGGHDSGWQYDTAYEDTGLTPNTMYTYTVKARDISKNLNETAESSAESATTDSYAGSIIFSDGFESGDFAAGGWEVGGSSYGVTSKAAYTGSYGARLGKGAWMEKTLSTVGYTDIRIRYMRNTSSSATF
ncbi:MAG: right-handed parallel beta-helix repeat-containing protein, partial [Planctomycetota bacterium]